MKECIEALRVRGGDDYELINDKPGFFGPMRHKVTGEGYWEHNVRLEHEQDTRIKNAQRKK
jgi:hypothetical protein